MACGQRLLQNNPTTARCGHLASSYITQAWLCSRWYHLKKTYKSPALLSSQQLPQSFPHLGSKHAAVCMVWAGHPSTGGLIGPASPSRMLQIKTKVCGGSTSAFCCVFHMSPSHGVVLPSSCHMCPPHLGMPRNVKGEDTEPSAVEADLFFFLSSKATWHNFKLLFCCRKIEAPPGAALKGTDSLYLRSAPR